jgi:hypothetical protein
LDQHSNLEESDLKHHNKNFPLWSINENSIVEVIVKWDNKVETFELKAKQN